LGLIGMMQLLIILSEKGSADVKAAIAAAPIPMPIDKAKALIAAVAPRLAEWRSEATARIIRDTPFDLERIAPEPGLHHPTDVVAALEAALPQGWQMVNSSGHCAFYCTHMPSRPNSRFLTIREFGAIGNGISFAIGVAAARPEETVVLFDGDGSLLMHVQELETIRRQGLNILVCVLNDGAYGSEIHKLRSIGLSDEGAVFGRPDFAAVARGFGLGGARVQGEEQLALLDHLAVAEMDRLDIAADAGADIHALDRFEASRELVPVHHLLLQRRGHRHRRGAGRLALGLGGTSIKRARHHDGHGRNLQPAHLRNLPVGGKSLSCG
jgi:thiamine pyrophosphate-dependent acetolactate synthase large subunit-like protein